MILLSLLVSLPAWSPAAFPQQEEAPPRGRAEAWRLDEVRTLDGETLEDVTILVRDGVIERMGQAVVVPAGARVHDLRGRDMVATPPLVLPHADFLVSDRRGRGNHSQYVAADSVWLGEDWAETLLEEGILVVGVDPPGSGLPGRTSVLLVDPEQRRRPEPLVADLHLVVTVTTNAAAVKLVRQALEQGEKAIEKEEKARKEWEKARREWEEKQKAKEAEQGSGKEGDGGQGGEQGSGGAAAGGDGDGAAEEEAPPEEFEPPEIAPSLRAVVEWLRQERVARVQIGSAADWLHWRDVLGERALPYELVLRHPLGTNLVEVVDDLAAAAVRVDVPARISFLPYTRIRVNLPAELAAAGVERLVLSPPSLDLRGVRDWRMAVAEVVAEGLDPEVALRAVTVEPAASLGQEELVAPLAVGGPATFTIWEGDPLDPLARARFVVHSGEVVYDRAAAEASETLR